MGTKVRHHDLQAREVHNWYSSHRGNKEKVCFQLCVCICAYVLWLACSCKMRNSSIAQSIICYFMFCLFLWQVKQFYCSKHHTLFYGLLFLIRCETVPLLKVSHAILWFACSCDKWNNSIAQSIIRYFLFDRYVYWVYGANPIFL